MTEFCDSVTYEFGSTTPYSTSLSTNLRFGRTVDDSSRGSFLVISAQEGLIPT
jgi:hypothetical protein